MCYNVSQGHPSFSTIRVLYVNRSFLAALRIRAAAAAAETALKYVRKGTELEKAELQAKRTLLNFERETVKAGRGALIYDNTGCSNHSVITQLRLPSDNIARWTAEYLATSPAIANVLEGQPLVQESYQTHPMASLSSATHDWTNLILRKELLLTDLHIYGSKRSLTQFENYTF